MSEPPPLAPVVLSLVMLHTIIMVSGNPRGRDVIIPGNSLNNLLPCLGVVCLFKPSYFVSHVNFMAVHRSSDDT